METVGRGNKFCGNSRRFSWAHLGDEEWFQLGQASNAPSYCSTNVLNYRWFIVVLCIVANIKPV